MDTNTKKKTLFAKYRKMVEQAFIPIFVRDAYNTDVLLKGCELAGLNCIEYTLRREDAKQVIPTLKKRYPNLIFTVGSTLDSDKMVYTLSQKYPQLMTMRQVLDAGADGLVSMLPMSDETIQRYANDYILIPSAFNAWDAFRQVNTGAHYIKLLGSDITLVKSVNLPPVFRFCPTFVTGGVTPDTMDSLLDAGATLFASGFDLILEGIEEKDITPELVAARIRLFKDAAVQKRTQHFNEFKDIGSLSDKEFIHAMPNYCSFDE